MSDPAEVSSHTRLRRLMVVFGTRPEAIKLAPVIRAARAHSDWNVVSVHSGQHRELVTPVLEALQIQPDRVLDTMRPGSGLNPLTARLIAGLDSLIGELRPDAIVVQGDTTTAFAGALTGFHRRVLVAHVEAGLRTDNLDAPFPEEANRQLISRIATLHLAPTPGAAAALRREHLPAPDIEVTGNTVVDALTWMAAALPADGSPPHVDRTEARVLSRFSSDRRVVLITGHRRESFSGGLVAVCGGIARLAAAFPEVDFVYPVHLNPEVGKATHAALGGLANVHLIAPVGYASSVWLIRRCAFIITDSGGLQEEAPTLGKPVLVTREATERPEGVQAGCALIVGYDVEALVARASAWLADSSAMDHFVPTQSPYGDGRAALRVVAAVRTRLGLAADPVEAWP